MDFDQTATYSEKTIRIENHLPAIGKDSTIESIFAGLIQSPKFISSIYFYDVVGSKLFEAITQLPEYYLTRTEQILLDKVFHDLGPTLVDVDIVELGSGDCSKISMLLDVVPVFQRKTLRYIPVDISRPAIKESADLLIKKYPGLHIHGFVADFLTQLHLIPKGRKRLFCFLGSTLGNLTHTQSRHFFKTIGSLMQSGDLFILGVDMVKDIDVLEKAYNDNQKITVQFNQNILNVVNQITGSDFQSRFYKHVAFYNPARHRIEMHLEATRDMTISSPLFPQDIKIYNGERIHTENSYKFTLEIIKSLITDTGLHMQHFVSDSRNWFSLIQFSKDES